jgi:hypothetical protein
MMDVGDHPGSLLGAWNRTATSGAGVDMLRRRHDNDAVIAFLTDSRLPVPVVKGYQKQNVTKNDKRGARGKTFNYEREGKELREVIDISRRIEGEHRPVPTRWEDVDKASHKRRPGGPFVPTELTSRLCGRGDLEGIDGLRSDSHTAEIESHHLLFSFAASSKLKIKTADVSNAYFQGKQLDRLLLTRPPKGGIPEPVYEDRENKIAKAMYVIEVDGKVMGIMVTHVDDLQRVLDSFSVRKIEEGGFRSCGKEIKQLPDFSIEVTCEDTTETIDDDATEAAIGQMRSVVGSLGWIARQCRPGLGCMISNLQGVDSEAKENCHICGWRSLTDNRVCRSILQAEAHGMILEEEMRSRLRAIMADCKGLILDLKGWKRTSQESVKHLWLSDCESLVYHLKNPKNKRLENVRLSIDVQGLKQVLWKKADGTDLEELLPATQAGNAVRWIDMSCMIVDCLTKKMKPDVTHRLQEDGKNYH